MKYAALVMALFSLLFGMGGCSMPEQTAGAGAEDSEAEEDRIIAVPVQVELPHRGEIAAHFETTSRVEAEHRVEVMSEGVGRAERILVEEGDTVRRGEVIAELETREAQASLRQAEVQMRQNEVEYDRAKRGYEAGVIPRMEYENAQFAYEQSKANFEAQQIQFENLTVRAPLTGAVTEMHARSGMLISSGNPVCTIVDPSTYRLVVHAPERDLPRLELGQRASVAIDALDGETFDARVSRINPSVDPTSGTVRVVLEFADEAKERLREAAFARVRLVMTTREDALLVPKDGVLEEAGRRFVYVVVDEDGNSPGTDPMAPDKEFGRLIAERRYIETGLEDSHSTEVVSGLDEDAFVVTVGHYNLRHGADVRLMDPDEELQAGLDMPADEALERARDERAAGRRRQEAMEN